MKKRLFTPGPTPVPESVMLKMAEPMIHHRHAEFMELFERVSANLQYLFQTRNEVLTLTSSGTGAMEAVVSNVHSNGETAIYVNGGKFGERWGELLGTYGIKAVEIKVEWGDSVEARRVEQALRSHPEAAAIYLTHSETSTGAATDVRSIASLVRESSRALVVVDGITAVGAMELRMDDWNLDVVVTGSQKGLMIPPGLAFVAANTKAWERITASNLPKYYFDLLRAKKALESKDTPWTPAISLIKGVDSALALIRKEGIEEVWARHARMSKSVRAAVRALGLKLVANHPSAALTAVWIPESVKAKEFLRIFKEKQGITVAGGQGILTGRIFRISHLGYYDELDIIALVSALEKSLVDSGYRFEVGNGVRAAQREFVGNG